MKPNAQLWAKADSRTALERGIYAASASKVFSAAKRHKCHAPFNFLNPPWLWAQFAIVALGFFLAGCGEHSGGHAAGSKSVTFKTAEAAPDAFDAWDFVWRGPKRGLNVDLECVVLQPDGSRYAEQRFSAYPGNSDKIQSSFSPGFAGGDPKVFWRQPIRLRFQVAKGELVFLPADIASFKFRFFTRDTSGDVDWRRPFKTIAVVQE